MSKIKMRDELILEDEEVIVLAPRDGFVKGHLIIIPKQEHMILEQVPDSLIEKMFQVANKLSTVLFDSLQCQGTNILIQNGVSAGQINKLFSVNVLPRYENDSLKFEWELKQASEDSLKESESRFKSSDSEEEEKHFIEDQKKKTEKKTDETILKEGGEKENYLLKSLDRVA